MKALRVSLVLSSVCPPLFTYSAALIDPSRAMQWIGGATFALEVLAILFHVILTIEISPQLGPFERAHIVLW